jgi:adenylate cyclase
MGALSQFYEAVGELILRYEATLEQFTSDSIMAIFNDPMPCVEHTATAVRMAVEIRERMQAVTDAWRRNGFDLDAGIGIAEGYATLGRVGFEGRFDYRATGSVVNLASRLCSQALGGQILLSPARLCDRDRPGGRRTGRPTPAQGIPRPCERVQRDAPQGVVADVRAVRYPTSPFFAT